MELRTRIQHAANRFSNVAACGIITMVSSAVTVIPWPFARRF